LIRLLGDLLSPPQCAACGLAVSRHHVFCASCATTVERCDALDNAAHFDAVARDGDLTPAHVAFGYYGGALAIAIRRLKYEDRPYLARPLGELLRSACRAAKIGAEAVLPVPLHPRRLAERGYNQSALLAAHVAHELGAPLFTSVLARRVDTAPQVELSGDERHANVVAAFAVTSPASVERRALVLVDDVSTTGATLSACRQALLAAGARRVLGIAVARTFPNSPEIPLGLDNDAVPDIGVRRARASSGCADGPLRANLRN
jgi:ComF family protein